MLLFIAMFLTISIIADAKLHSEMRHEAPDLYQKLGRPSNLSLMCSPLHILRHLVFLVTPSPFARGDASYPWLWLTRLALLGLVVAVLIDGATK
jgi:hypothetical protein